MYTYVKYDDTTCTHRSAISYTWPQARGYCTNDRADLVKIETAAFNTYLTDRRVQAWIGLTDRLIKGRHAWTDGSPVSVSII